MGNNALIVCVKLLDRTFTKKGFSNIVLNSGLSLSDLSERDKRFCTALYYGVIERKITLDYIISRYSKKPPEKLDTEVLQILRLGVYQLLYMNSVQDNAAVNEMVNVTNEMKYTSAKGFVNAVLRNFIRDGKKTEFPADKLSSLSIKYSSPIWLVRKWLEEYPEETENLLESTIAKPPVTIRVNNLKISEKSITDYFQGNNIEYEKIRLLDNCYNIKCGDVRSLDGFKRGFFHVQDLSSQLCCHALCPQDGEIVFDLCAAPGGKTFTLSELSDGKSTVYSFDIHSKRTALIEDGAERLGLKNIIVQQGDATEFNPQFPKADKVLCDVVCGGLGVIRRKPEIKYKSQDEFQRLPEIQYEILCNGARYLKVGGELIYSTCTLSRAENDEVAERFLKNNPGFEGKAFLQNLGKPFGDYKATVFPSCFGGDGFFIAKFRKKN